MNNFWEILSCPRSDPGSLSQAKKATKSYDIQSLHSIFAAMLRKFIYSLLLLAGAGSLSAQEAATLLGKITDVSAKPVPNASVYILNTQTGTSSDKQGNFELTGLAPGKYTVEISAIGYAIIHKTISLPSTEPLQFLLSESTVQLDEVVVSAQKKEERLQQLPFSISALNAKKIEQYRIWNTKEITAIIPNLYAANPGDDRNVTSIRGITSSSYDPAVATYIDGVNQFSLDTYIAQLFDVERIEVLRGPQGTLYGRNAMGGVINIITRKPLNYSTGFAEVTVGNYGRERYSAGLRLPLISNKLFLGVAAMYSGMDGYYTNEFNNSDFDKQHAITGNYYLTYIASKKLSFSLNAKHNNNRNNGPFTLVNGIDAAFENPFMLNQNATSKMIDNTFNTSLSVNYTGPAINFSSQTAWQSNHRYYTLPLDGDFSPIDGVTIINNYGKHWNNVKVFTQEFRLSSPASVQSRINWTTGVYLFHQSVPNKQATRYGADAGMLGSPDINFSTINTSTGKNFGTAVYGQASYALTNQLSLTAGLRYDYEHKKQAILGEYQADPNPDPVFETRPDTTGKASFNAFSPKLSLAYSVTENNNLYASYSRGYRAGGFTQLSSDPSVPPLYAYDPEYSNNFEIGIKNNWLNNRLRLNLAFFYANITNAQVPTLVLPDAVTITKNAGRLNTKGLEAELSAKPVKGLDIEYNFGYTDATYKTLKISQNGSEQNFSGKRQVFTPETTSSLAAQYSFSPGKNPFVKLIIRGEWTALGEHYFDLANAIRQKAYSLFNTRFGVTTRKVDIMCWVRNIADEKYISYAYDFGAVQLGAPQTFGITLTGRF